MLRILMVDNYDSFTYNLVQLIMSNAPVEMVVKRNDEFELKYIHDLAPDGIVISPGPKRPKDAGLSIETIKEFSLRVPILGICLGMQCINEVFGGGLGRRIYRSMERQVWSFIITEIFSVTYLIRLRWHDIIPLSSIESPPAWKLTLLPKIAISLWLFTIKNALFSEFSFIRSRF